MWPLGAQKRVQWTNEIRAILKNGYLEPAMASKFCGRLAFLNAYIFNCLGAYFSGHRFGANASRGDILA